MVMSRKEASLIKVMSIFLAFMMVIWGFLNIQMGSPYGEIGRILGIVQIFFGISILYIYWRF